MTDFSLYNRKLIQTQNALLITHRIFPRINLFVYNLAVQDADASSRSPSSSFSVVNATFFGSSLVSNSPEFRAAALAFCDAARWPFSAAQVSDLKRNCEQLVTKKFFLSFLRCCCCISLRGNHLDSWISIDLDCGRLGRAITQSQCNTLNAPALHLIKLETEKVSIPYLVRIPGSPRASGSLNCRSPSCRLFETLINHRVGSLMDSRKGQYLKFIKCNFCFWFTERARIYWTHREFPQSPLRRCFVNNSQIQVETTQCKLKSNRRKSSQILFLSRHPDRHRAATHLEPIRNWHHPTRVQVRLNFHKVWLE